MFAHQVDRWRRILVWSSICVAGVWSSIAVVVRRIPAELSIHSFGVCGRRMFVVLVCSYVRGRGGQRCHVVQRVWLLVVRP